MAEDTDSTPATEDGTVSDPDNNDTANTTGGDDYDPAGIAIQQVFDLALTKVYDSYVDIDSDGQISAGDEVIFTITVHNQGTIDATDVAITDYVPADLIYTATNSVNVANGWDANATTSIANLPAGTNTSVQIALTIDPAFQGSSIINDAEITDASNSLGLADEDSTPNDNSTTASEMNSDNDIADHSNGGADNPNDSDDFDPAEIMVGQVFDLALAKTINTSVNPGPYAPGDNVTFAIEVMNQGSLDAYNVQISDYIPQGLILADADWTSFLGTATMITPIASIPAGTSSFVDITFTIDPAYSSRDAIVNYAGR